MGFAVEKPLKNGALLFRFMEHIRGEIIGCPDDPMTKSLVWLIIRREEGVGGRGRSKYLPPNYG
jgi:hypothetical protein